MTVTVAMVVFGSILIYGGWSNRSVWALARGDNTAAKSAEVAAGKSPTAIQGPAHA